MRCLSPPMLIATQAAAPQPPPAAPASRTQVVLLGTGSPPADPLRSGPATAIVVNDTSYLVDLGPGIVRRAAAAAEKGIPVARGEPAADRVRHASALRSHRRLSRSHLLDLGAGPPRAAEGLRAGRPRRHDEAHHAGVAGRHRHQDDVGSSAGRRPGSTSRRTTSRRAWSTRTRTSRSPRFPTRTASGRPPSATASTPPIASIVISGDTNPSEALVQQCRKCDVLIHEAYSDAYRPADMAELARIPVEVPHDDVAAGADCGEDRTRAC